MTYNRLLEHFPRSDLYINDKFRSQLEARAIGKNEKIAKYMKWHRELRAHMIDAKFPGIVNEAKKIKWVVRGLVSYHQYGQLASLWRDSDPPPPSQSWRQLW